MVWNFIKKQRAILEVEQRRNRASTYMEPLKGGDLPGEQEALKEFLHDFYRNILYKKQKEMRDLLNNQYPESMGQQYRSLVREQKVVSNDDFWMRYYYRCNVDHVLREWEWADQRKQLAQAEVRAQKEAEARIANQAAAAQQREAAAAKAALAKRQQEQQQAAAKARAAKAAKETPKSAAKAVTKDDENTNPLTSSAAAVMSSLSTMLGGSDHNKNKESDAPFDEKRNGKSTGKTVPLQRVATKDRADVIVRGIQRRELMAGLVVLVVSLLLVGGDMLPLPTAVNCVVTSAKNGLCAPLPPGWRVKAVTLDETEETAMMTRSMTSPWWIPVDMTLPNTSSTVKDVVSDFLCGDSRPRTRAAWKQEKNGVKLVVTDLATKKTLVEKKGMTAAAIGGGSLEFTKSKKDQEVTESVVAPWKVTVGSSDDA